MSPDKLSDFVNRVTSIMATIMREFARKGAKNSVIGKITIAQLVALENLNFHGETKMKDLAKFCSVSTPAMTGLIDRLVRDGFVLRVYEKEDRRIIKVRITNKGEQFLRKINEEKKHLLIKVFGKLSQKDRDEYLRILLQIKDNLSSSNEKNNI